MMKQDKSLKDTTLACSCNSGGVSCVYVTENKHIQKEVEMQSMHSIIHVKSYMFRLYTCV
jgi:uncharacterized protein YqkB